MLVITSPLICFCTAMVWGHWLIPKYRHCMQLFVTTCYTCKGSKNKQTNGVASSSDGLIIEQENSFNLSTARSVWQKKFQMPNNLHQFEIAKHFINFSNINWMSATTSYKLLKSLNPQWNCGSPTLNHILRLWKKNLPLLNLASSVGAGVYITRSFFFGNKKVPERPLLLLFRVAIGVISGLYSISHRSKRGLGPCI